jgi:hypothetical protein
MGTLHEDLCTLMLFPHRTRNVKDKTCRENKNTHFMQ